MNDLTWEEKISGRVCVSCNRKEKETEDTLWIADLSISRFLLFKDQRFRGYSLLVFEPRHVTSMNDLSKDEYGRYMDDLYLASSALRKALNPDHMNYELLGNSVPHLHWHIVPRFKTDPRWGQPIWEEWPRGEFTNNRVLFSDQENQKIVKDIQLAL